MSGFGSSFRRNGSTSWRDKAVDVFSRSSREEDDEEALKWAALEKLPTYSRLKKGLLASSVGAANEIYINDLGHQERRELVERLVKVAEEDNESFLLKLKNRMDRGFRYGGDGIIGLIQFLGPCTDWPVRNLVIYKTGLTLVKQPSTSKGDDGIGNFCRGLDNHFVTCFIILVICQFMENPNGRFPGLKTLKFSREIRFYQSKVIFVGVRVMDTGDNNLSRLSASLRRNASSLWGANTAEAFSRSSREEDDDEEALRWAAIEKLPTYNRLRKGLLASSIGAANEVDVEDLGFQEKKKLMERLVNVAEEDNERFLLKLKNRIESRHLSWIHEDPNTPRNTNPSRMAAQPKESPQFIRASHSLNAKYRERELSEGSSGNKLVGFGNSHGSLSKLEELELSSNHLSCTISSSWETCLLRIPVWWRWYYWGDPISWTLYGLVASQFGDVQERLLDSNNETVEEYLRSYFGFKHSFVGACAGVVFGLAVVFAFIFAFSIKAFNFQRR
ncbi:hypothetical protein RJ641_020060 [Dillenia turbinata]|uniref:Uncharacterized protein n=1 Tax=Dillenia turbinata TaxID=194707 RepID=A0AAN8YZ78_9MAGN